MRGVSNHEMKRKILTILTLTTALVAGIALTIPFVSSLSPSANAGSTLQHINISQLEAGDYLIEDDLSKGHFRARYLIIRDYKSNYRIFSIPVRDDRFLLPDVRWWRWGGLCSDFRPEIQKSKIIPEGVIKCHDQKFLNDPNPEWRWAYDGRNLGNYTENMFSVTHKVEGPYLIVGKK